MKTTDSFEQYRQKATLTLEEIASKAINGCLEKGLKANAGLDGDSGILYFITYYATYSNWNKKSDTAFTKLSKEAFLFMKTNNVNLDYLNGSIGTITAFQLLNKTRF
ncbi:MAG: hypothetical protein QM727_04410 [Niabella sp.]